METSSSARKLSRAKRLSWIEALDACPVCGDGGTATPASRDRWRHSGMPREEPYGEEVRWPTLDEDVSVRGLLGLPD
jgi:hypothetical protein